MEVETVVVVNDVTTADTLAATGVKAVALGTISIPQKLSILRGYRSIILSSNNEDETEKLVRKLVAGGQKVYVADADLGETLQLKGPEAMREVIRRAVAGPKWLVQRLAPGPDAGDQDRDAFLASVFELAAALQADPVAVAEILTEAANILRLPQTALAEAWDRQQRARRAQEAEALVRRALREAAQERDWRKAVQKVVDARDRAAVLVQDPPQPVDPTALEQELASQHEGLPFPWLALNRLCRIDPGGLTTVYAASGFGKTNFLYALLLHYLEKFPGSVLFWSGEMAPRRIYQRLLSIISGLDTAEIEYGFRSGLRKKEMIEAQEKLRAYASRLYILEPSNVPDTTALTAAVTTVAYRQPITAVMVDYLQQMLPPGKLDGTRYGTREQEVTAVARELHGLGQALSVPVIAAVQINRAGGMARKPQQDDARESGAIEQYSQLILGLWNSNRAGMHALRDGVTPAAPEEGWYWQDDEEATAMAAAMAESHGGTLLECAILKSRYYGHENMAVPLVYFGATGRIETLPTSAATSRDDSGKDGGNNGNKKTQAKQQAKTRKVAQVVPINIY